MEEKKEIVYIYEQSTGILYDGEGHEISRGYSGKGEHKNQPSSEGLENYGLIPRGTYLLKKPKGKVVIDLIPLQKLINGRHSFQIHGDSIENLGTASQGCIILGKDVRLKISEQPETKKLTLLLTFINQII